MKLAKISPDIRHLEITDHNNGKVRVVMESVTKKGQRKRIEEEIDGPKQGQDPMDWLKINAAKIGAKLMFA